MGGSCLLMEFRQLDFTHTILEFCCGFALIHIGNVEGTGHLAVAALPADVVALAVLLVK